MVDNLVDPLIGTVLAERYRIREMMSQGGFGKVYRAEHVTIGRPLAVKVMSAATHQLDDDERRRRFLSEARATSQIRHPNVIDIIDFGHTESGLAFYVMELLNGEDLAQTLRRHGPLQWARLGPMVLQICRALTAAHRLGIVHRDIKPANCFRIEVEDDPDFIKVLDFGIAKIYAPAPGMDVPLTATHMLMGTPAYMAPEFTEGTPADERSDIYALGIVMYELATGVRPIGGVDFVSILFNHRYTEPVPPRALAPDLPEEAEFVILRALRKDPAQRQQSMRELHDEVRASLAGPAPLAPVEPAAPRTRVVLRTIAAESTHIADSSVATIPALRPPTTPPHHRRAAPLVLLVAGVLAVISLWFGLAGSDTFETPSRPPAGLPRAPDKPVRPPPPLTDTTPIKSLPPAPTLAPLKPDPGPASTPSEPFSAAASEPPAPKRPPAARPAFDAARAQARLERAIKAGVAACCTRHNAAQGFEFQITVTVAASGGATASGSVNSALRRCLMDLVTTKISLGATATGGTFSHSFRSP